MAMATALLVARLVAAAFVDSSGSCGNGSGGGMVTMAAMMSVVARARAMALSVLMVLLVERLMVVARV